MNSTHISIIKETTMTLHQQHLFLLLFEPDILPTLGVFFGMRNEEGTIPGNQAIRSHFSFLVWL